jgi:hypothetical protein
MADRSLAEFIAIARSATEPSLTSGNTPQPGGVDPLGLRQINFDLMDCVLPGINNVARHIRPFVVVTWAWRRAAQLAGKARMTRSSVAYLQDFVDRIEVLYAWSQFIRNPSADLPGRDVLAEIISQNSFRFGGAVWEKRRETRRLSTAFSAPINYGPALKSLRWLEAAEDGSGAMRPSADAISAIDALEECMAAHLEHPAFSQLGDIEVSGDDVREWGEAWSLDAPTEAERTVMAELLGGESADKRRRFGVALAVQAAYALAPQEGSVRRAMCGSPTDFHPPGPLAETSTRWRKVQVRQVFRLALEALFAWSIGRLGIVPTPTEALVSAFLRSAPTANESATTNRWLSKSPVGVGPVDLLEDLEGALATKGWEGVPEAFCRAIAFCFAEGPHTTEAFEQSDRLPIAMASKQAEGWLNEPPAAFVRHIFEAWLFGQHTYWSVGRGLADARAGGKILLRLRVVLEEGGWTLTPGASAPRPIATADRLATILSLATEAGLLMGGEAQSSAVD